MSNKMFATMTAINSSKPTALKTVFRILLGLLMLYAGISHLSINRMEFQAQVPDWLPLGTDLVVILSGVVEIMLGAAMVYGRKIRVQAGIALAVFYILIFPGNINQYVNQIDAFGLDTDKARMIRLWFQPVLVLWALWSTNAILYLKEIFSSK